MADRTRERVIELTEKKERIEREIGSLFDVLKSNGVGMSESLVDAEGYPLNSVDVYQVRIARNKIICLQNDHRAVMQEIESGLSEYYASGTGAAEVVNEPVVRSPSRPILMIADVAKGSPADEAGLRDGDLVCEFGSLNVINFRDVSDVANVVRHCENSTVRVIIERNGTVMSRGLRPRKWHGRGLLGCRIVETDQSVDR